MIRRRAARVGGRVRALVRALLLLLVAAVAGLPSLASAAAPTWRLDAGEVPELMFVELPVRVHVTLTNEGEEAWSPAQADRLAYHWRDAEGELVDFEGRRSELPHAVAPGESVELDALVQPPSRAGRYQLEWAMVREGVQWYPRPAAGHGVEVVRPVEVRVGRIAWALREVGALAPLEARAEATVTIVVENRGEVPWGPRYGDFLAYHWRDGDGRLVEFEGRRTPLPREVAAGEELGVELLVQAPEVAGLFALEVEPVREGITWYGVPQGAAPAPVLVEVTPRTLAWTLLDHDTPARMSAGEVVEVRVDVANTGREEWSAGDRLSYRWTDLAGRRVAEGARAPLVDVLSPGESTVVVARVEAPREPGEYLLAWEPLREHEFWFGPGQDAMPPSRVIVERPRLAWRIEHAAPVPALAVGGEVFVDLRLRNTGALAWSSASGDRLAYHWLDASGRTVEYEGRRTRFEGEVAPGEAVELAARVVGPAQPGRYRLQWEMVREHVQWFGGEVDAQGRAVDPDALESPQVVVRSPARGLQALLAGLALLLALVARWHAPRSATYGRLHELGVLAWAWAALWVSTLSFAELAELELSSRGAWLAPSVAALFALPVACAGGRLRRWIAALVVIAVAMVGVGDLVYMQFYGSIIPFAAATAAQHVGEIGESIVALIDADDAWLLPVAVAGLLAAFILPAPPRPSETAAAAASRTPSRWRTRGPRLAVLLTCLAGVAPFALRLGEAMHGELGLRVFSEQRNAARFGYLGAHVFDLARTLREWRGRGRASEAERGEIREHFAARAQEVADDLEVTPRAAESAGTAAGANLLLIQVEAAQRWVIGARVEGQEITPRLNRLHERGFAFANLVDQTAQGQTSDAEYATLSSQHPLREGAICFLRADNQFYTLAHVLAEHGYSTLSAHPYKRGFWNRAVLHPRYGFERSLFHRDLGAGQEVGWGLADGLFFARMAKELRALPQPWFAFLITLSLHHPYEDFPANLKELELGELEGTPLGNYLHGMNYFDRSLAALLDELEAAGLADSTVVALYGDHDARFDLAETPKILELGGEPGWSPSVGLRFERVPFFVLLPDRELHGVVDELGGHVDIAPTLLHYLGIARPRAFAGHPLLPGSPPRPVAYPDGSGFAEDRVYAAQGRDIPSEGGCFDYPAGTSRPREDCDELASWVERELRRSREVVDHDLHRALAGR